MELIPGTGEIITGTGEIIADTGEIIADIGEIVADTDTSQSEVATVAAIAARAADPVRLGQSSHSRSSSYFSARAVPQCVGW
jgi:hypothetical protein